MNKTAKRRFLGAFEIFKTILLVLLVILLIVLVVVYISGMKVYENTVMKKKQNDSFDKLWSVQSGIQPEGINSDHLLPEFVGYKQSTFMSARGCVGDADSVTELYELVKPCILELFGSEAVCRALSADNGVDAFERAKKSDEFIYIRYHVPVLYQLIYAFAADTLTVSESDVAVGGDGNIGAYVSELIIVPDKDFAAHRFVAYASDGAGRYFEFRPAQHIVTSGFYISKLADGAQNIEAYGFDFIDGTNIAAPDAEIECSVISKSTSDYPEQTDRNALLRLFKYNPDKLDWYTDGEVDVYIDSHSQLRIGNGIISFSTSDSLEDSGGTMRGIEIETLLGYTVDGAPSLFDKLSAVDNLVGRLGDISPSLVGGTAVPCLGDVYTDKSLLTVEYFLTYNNIRIGTEPYLRAVITENTISEIELLPVYITGSKETVLVPKPMYVVRKLDELEMLPLGLGVKAVSLNYTGSNAEWTVSAK